jgi:hypothetical protein
MSTLTGKNPDESSASTAARATSTQPSATSTTNPPLVPAPGPEIETIDMGGGEVDDDDQKVLKKTMYESKNWDEKQLAASLDVEPNRSSVAFTPKDDDFAIMLSDSKIKFRIRNTELNAIFLKIADNLAILNRSRSFISLLNQKKVNSYDAQLCIFIEKFRDNDLMKRRQAISVLTSVCVNYNKFVEVLKKGFQIEGENERITALTGIIDIVNNSASAEGAHSGLVTFSFLQALGYVMANELPSLEKSEDDFYLPYMSKFISVNEWSFFRSVVVAYLPVNTDFIKPICQALCLFHFKAYSKFEASEGKEKSKMKKRNWVTVFRKKLSATSSTYFAYAAKLIAPAFAARVLKKVFMDARGEITTPDNWVVPPFVVKAEVLARKIQAGKHSELTEEEMIEVIKDEF